MEGGKPMSIFTSPLAPRLRPLELAASYVSRLAAWLRYTNARQFCADFELNFDGISAGKADQLQALADLTETPIEDLGHSPVRSGGRFHIDGQVLSTAYLDRVDLWVCPACIAADLAAAPHLPPEAAIAICRDSIISAIAGCVHHRSSLVFAGRDEWRYGRHDTSLVTMDIPGRLPLLTAMSKPMNPSPIDVFVRERFDGLPQSIDALHGVPLNQVLKLTGNFGNWSLMEGKENLRNLDRLELNKIRSAGLQILAGGQDAIAAEMNRLMEETHVKGNVPVRRAMRKVWYMLMDNSSEPAFMHVRQAVVQASRQNRYSSRANPSIDGQPRWRPVQQAGLNLGFGGATVCAFATEAGATHPSKPNLVNEARLSEWISLDGGIVPVWQAAREAGMTELQMANLIEHSRLVPVVRKVQKQGTWNWLRRDHVAGMLDACLADAIECSDTPSGKTTIRGMVRRSTGSFLAIHDAVFSGRIWVGKLAGAKPYASILVDIAEVAALLQSDHRPNTAADRDSESMTRSEFARRCGIGSVAAHRLASPGGLVHYEERVDPATGRSRATIPVSELDRFQAEFITGTKLARLLRVQPRAIVQRLHGEGIRPVDLRDIPITLFRRSEVAGLLPG